MNRQRRTSNDFSLRSVFEAKKRREQPTSITARRRSYRVQATLVRILLQESITPPLRYKHPISAVWQTQTKVKIRLFDGSMSRVIRKDCIGYFNSVRSETLCTQVEHSLRMSIDSPGEIFIPIPAKPSIYQQSKNRGCKKVGNQKHIPPGSELEVNAAIEALAIGQGLDDSHLRTIRYFARFCNAGFLRAYQAYFDR